MKRPLVHHIPVCPFSQRLEILLALKGAEGAFDFSTVDITKPRDPALLAKTRGVTALPVLETPDGAIIRESLVILRYLDDMQPPQIARAAPYERAVENMLVAMEGDFANAGYRFVMNRDQSRRADFAQAMDAQYARLNDYLLWQAPDRVFLFERFGIAEAVFTPLFVRFQFLDYYEGYDIPERLERVRAWRDACMAHPAAQQVSREEIVKLYCDYALGVGNGALAPGRTRSSFVFEPHWSKRPWPPRDKWGPSPSDEALGLL
ncbi:MAG: glutathione S-transferase family protein [Beijerinckiaceae bacterium]|nr:glutathione S-transferase family protein [Beijerinckiaceae bacterium]